MGLTNSKSECPPGEGFILHTNYHKNKWDLLISLIFELWAEGNY